MLTLRSSPKRVLGGAAVIAIMGACGGNAQSGSPPPLNPGIGVGGGTVTLGPVSLVVPPGALDSIQDITIGDVGTSAPFTLLSHVYQFGPPGLTFKIPATVEFSGVSGVAPLIEWSTGSDVEFTALQTTIQGSVVSAPVVHFSEGLVAESASLADAGADSGPADASDVLDSANDANQDGAPYCPPSTDFKADPLNCGSCGHSCLGGACASSACQPVLISSTEANPTGMAADSTGAFWANQGTQATNYTDGSVRFLSVTSATPQTLTQGPMSGGGVASDGTNFFFDTMGTFADGGYSGDGQMLQCPVAGCPANPIVLATNQPGYIVSIALSASEVFWGAGYIEAAAKGGGGPPTQFAGGGGQLRVFGNAVYWVNGSVIQSAPFTGAPVTNVYSSSNSGPLIQGIGVDSLFIYWAECDPTGMGTNCSIFSCALPSCTGKPTVLASAGAVAEALTIDPAGQNLFWWDDATGSAALKTCSKTSCSPSFVASGGAYDIVATDNAIYWDINASIYRLAR